MQGRQERPAQSGCHSGFLHTCDLDSRHVTNTKGSLVVKRNTRFTFRDRPGYPAAMCCVACAKWRTRRLGGDNVVKCGLTHHHRTWNETFEGVQVLSFVSRETFYFPIQKVLKILSSTSSAVVCPTISERASKAMRRSIATSSPGLPQSRLRSDWDKPSRARWREIR